MKGKLLILLFITFSLFLFAQAPDWQWATKAGGIMHDNVNKITIDNAGSSYITGHFQDIATFGPYSLTSYGDADIFVAKMDADGNWLWVIQGGGNYTDVGFGITIDDVGNSYVTGRFDESASFGPYSLTSNGLSDIFVAKIDADGNWLWVIQGGGADVDIGYKLTIDGAGNSYVTGYFKDTATFGSYSLTSSGDYDIFVAKMDANGNWQWVTQAGGTNIDVVNDIAIDNVGNNYVTGYFTNSTTFGSYFLTSSGINDIFVAKINTTGNWLWATQAGGTSMDRGSGITIDNAGNSYVTGIFEDTASFGSNSLTSYGDADIFVAKMDVEGNWIWTNQGGGDDLDYGLEITIDDAENCYITGAFNQTAIFGSHSLTSNGGRDIFVAKMDANGNWQWVTQAGGIFHDIGRAIALDDAGNTYVTGTFNETAIFGSYSLTSSGYWDIFVAKLGNDASVENEIIPTKMELSNYPNPFNPITTISFSLQNDSNIELSVFNIKGQMIKSLLSDQMSVGEHSIIWNGEDDAGKNVSSGVYLYKLNVNGKNGAVKKCLLLK